jgi:hypothetical protein
MSFYTTHFAHANEDWSGAAVKKTAAREEEHTIEALPEELRPAVDMSKLWHSPPAQAESRPWWRKFFEA